jgi:hypothetical protein
MQYIQVGILSPPVKASKKKNLVAKYVGRIVKCSYKTG